MPMSLSFVVKAFLSWTEKNRSPGTAYEYRRHLEKFLKHTTDKDVSQLRAWDLLEWSETWHQTQAVQRCFNWAVQEADLLEKSPFKKVKLPKLGKRKRILDRRLLARLYRTSSRPFRRFLFALRETIGRPQEIRSVCWEHLTWQEKPENMAAALVAGEALFVLEEYKGKSRRTDPDEPRIIAISPRLGRLLACLARKLTKLQGPIFLNSKGRPWTSNAIRCRMKWLRKKLGLARDHRGENVVAYTLRHTLATWAAAAGVRDRILAHLMGHTSTRTTARYQHLQVEHLRDALNRLHSHKRGKRFRT